MFTLLFLSQRSATFELHNLSPYYSNKTVDVYLNQQLVLSNWKKNLISLYDLAPCTEYKVQIGSDSMIFKTLTESEFVNVFDLGAIGDGVSDDTFSIQSAIDSCPNDGTVIIPEGTYRVTPLFLKSGVSIFLKKNAIILGETNRMLYPILPARKERLDGSILEVSSWEGAPNPTFASILTGIEVKDVRIFGEGIVDCNAQNGDWWVHPKEMIGGAYRPKGIYLSNCENISFQGVTVKNTPSWNLHPYFSKTIRFIDMRLESPKDSPNTDGCDPESCDGVDIIGVDFSVGDDCIAIKSGKFDMGMLYHKPCENITVRNCHMSYGHGAVVLGSEMSGGIRNLNVSQCLFENTDRGLRIKTRRGRGKYGIIDGITFENITMIDVRTPLVMNMYYFCDIDGKTAYVWSKTLRPVDDRTPYLGSFTFRNIICENVHVAPGYFYGLPESPIESITLENIQISYAENPKAHSPAMMSFLDPYVLGPFEFHFVNRVVMKNITYTNNPNQDIILDHVKEYSSD